MLLFVVGTFAFGFAFSFAFSAVTPHGTGFGDNGKDFHMHLPVCRVRLQSGSSREISPLLIKGGFLALFEGLGSGVCHKYLAC